MAIEGFHPVGRIEDLAPGQSKVVTINNRSIALFNVDGQYFAIYNICPHEGGPLNEGRVKGFVVSCPWHDLAFDIRNGQGTDGGGYCVGSYEVRVDGGEVFVGPRRKT
ncbi:putative 2Fe-2S ferredoxin [Nitrospira sp. KM1]|uniref:Rieske (2Fe-2S) protein n=1 Tax=Nitrospira sp. KM1 TaxID=1936990 RepID=UPI0013A7B550|nr:Rieske 2Fe-2S domain-containing protein [Nitrospira sp. KM1]BCA55014.1 putative 2Fe-2S ferredoxin [Nitrospira sp. KM1]